MSAALTSPALRPLTIPCPVSWRRVLRLRDRPLAPTDPHARALEAWLQACGWERHGDDWHHPALRTPRGLFAAAQAAATMQAQALLEPRGWQLASGVVAKVGRLSLWLEAFEVARRSPGAARPHIQPPSAALTHEGFDARAVPAPTEPARRPPC